MCEPLNITDYRMSNLQRTSKLNEAEIEITQYPANYIDDVYIYYLY